jgi:all-trans-retinol dehydrogenase (NAD+)
LINNAGVARGKNILDATEKDVRFTFEVNTLAHYWMAKEFVPAMVARDHGMVVTVVSAILETLIQMSHELKPFQTS